MVLLILSLFVSSVFGFGRDGHCIVANVAQEFLSSEAANGVNFLLSGESMANVSNWADEIARSSEWKWSESLHYNNIRDSGCWKGESIGYVNCTFDYGRDCVDREGNNPGFCNVGAILNYTSILINCLASSKKDTFCIDALKFLIHFVGDGHQPLHCGLLRDRGGVEINVQFSVPYQGEDWNLHNVWDFGLIVRYEGIEGNWMGLANYLIDLLHEDWKERKVEWEKVVDPRKWAQQSLDASCTAAYRYVNGTQIPELPGKGAKIPKSYYKAYMCEKGLVDQQLAAGGVRLAAILNKIWAAAL